ncbi:MAG: hypothetical protein KatS3mg032_0725 [Cyclobacteriaceae bacterium]|nr:MAG: hypothetical protein KatS3mg032_0725 [Cyclobacteriaceae bacterium]
MNIPSDLKLQLIRLLAAGKRQQAVTYLRQQFTISTADAEKLISVLEDEITTSAARPLQSVAGLAGCAILVLRSASIIIGMMALLCLAGAAYFWYSAQQFAQQAIRLKGKVIELVPENSAGPAVAPVVAYRYNGRLFTYYSNNYSHPPDYEVNDEVVMLVSATDPEKATIDSFREQFSVSLGFVIIGAFLLAVSLTIGFIRRKLKKAFGK